MEKNGYDVMTSDIVVEVNNVSFQYRIVHGATSSIKENSLNFLKRRISTSDFEALSNVSFDLNRGETIAIIGRNGSGKSTLLKLLAGVLPPSQGYVRLKGSVAPMIELGAGFNPEMTGAENALLYSTILGRKLADTKLKLGQIAEWAELEEHFHLPIRTYSSGMIARLAFSIATAEVPELLIVDEVLSVGDLEFQRKSYQRMKSLMSSDTTVVLVTHDLKTAETMATKGIWLDHGRVRASGPIRQVIQEYVKDTN